MYESQTPDPPMQGLQGESLDLVAEVNAERERAAAAAVLMRQQRSRRARVLWLVFGVLAVASALAIYVGYARIRHAQRLTDAQQWAWSGHPDQLAVADATLQAMLSEEPDADDVQGLLAVVRVHQTMVGNVPLAEAEAAVAQAGTRGDGEVARAMLAALGGVSLDDRPASVSPADDAWMQGVAALASPDDRAAWLAAIVQLEASEGQTVRHDRVLAALAFRVGRVDDALELIASLRVLVPRHAGVMADWALYRALLGRDRPQAEALATAVVVADGLDVTARDRARAYVAQATLLAQRGQIDTAKAALERARTWVPPWDVDTADHALEIALGRCWGPVAEAWLDTVALGEVVPAIVRAWLPLMRGQVVEALARLAKTSQEHRRTAHAQALALVEQRRFKEAEIWIDRAQDLLPARVDLDVARARVALALGEDPTAVVGRLEHMATNHPHGARVWTAQAEALMQLAATAGTEHTEARDDALQSVLRTAIDREPRPAEAQLRRAQLLEAGGTSAKNGRQVLAHLRAAVDHAPDRALYREALGTYQAAIGQVRAADQTLRVALELYGGTIDGVLALVHLHLASAITNPKKPSKDVTQWLKTAARLGASAPQLQREWARYELALGKRESLERAEARLAVLAQTKSRDAEVLALYVRALDRRGDVEAAAIQERASLRRIPRKRSGPLYLALAANAASTDPRRAAQLAYRGWEKVSSRPTPGFELLVAAEQATRYWLSLKQPDGARAIARRLTKKLPLSPEAWVLRARMERHVGGEREARCDAVTRARALDPKVSISRRVRARC